MIIYKKINILCLLFLLNSCPGAYSGIPPEPDTEFSNLNSNPNIFLKAESVSLPFNKLGIYINREKPIEDLIANVKLSDGSIETNVDWLTSDPSIATISQYGRVNGLKEGRVIITARSKRDSNKFIELPLIVYSNNTSPRWLSNNKIAFLSNLNGKTNLYSVNYDGTEQKIISAGIISQSINKDNFQWSPQNDKIVFSSSIDTSTETKYLINIIEINGKSRNIEINNIIPVSFIWSNDNSKIAFIAITKDSNLKYLYVINADGSNLTKLTTNTNTYSNYYSYLSWSPDNQKIAYILGENSLNVFDSRLTKNTYIAPSNGFCWLADSSKLIYVPASPEVNNDTYDKASTIFKINIDGTNKETFLENNGLYYSNMVLSPDKTKITLVGSKQLSTFNPSYKLQDIFTISTDGTNFKNLTNNSFNTFITSDTNLSDTPDFALVNDITTFQYPKIRYDALPIWSPDSRYIAIPTTNNMKTNTIGFQKLDIISTENSKVTSHDIFSQDGDPNKNFSWSSDSNKIVFESNKFKQENINNIDVKEIYTLDINSSKITRLTNNNSINYNK